MSPGFNHRRWLGVLLAFALNQSIDAFSFHSISSNAVITRGPHIQLYSSSTSDDDSNAAAAAGEGEPSIQTSSVKIDDGGSDLTDRFKYKVHALMGTYDLQPGAVDDENQTGNIIGAMLQFPTEYTFTVVGKTIDNQQKSDNDESAGDIYASEVKSVLSSILGSDAKVEMRVVPRGKKFTRVSAKVNVESASVISSIYEELGLLEATAMKF